MTPLPLEHSTPLPRNISTGSVLCSSVFSYLDSKLGTNATASILSNADNVKALLRKAKPAILNQDQLSSIKTTDLSSRLLLNVNQSNLLWTSTGSMSGRLPEIKIHTGLESLREQCCPKCSTIVPSEISYCEHAPVKVIWTKLWIWTHIPVILPYEIHCFLSLL